MKRIITACAIPLVLMCMITASAGTAGSSTDPLISLSYINGEFTTSLKSDAAKETGNKLGEAYDKAFARLEEVYRSYVGYRFAPRYTELGLANGKKVNVTSGASFVLLSGSASLNIVSGSVVNVSTGFEVASGSLLAMYQRYFCVENTTAVITASSASTGQVDGYYNTDGIINPNGTVFKDVKKTDWFFPAVDFVYNSGLFAGTSGDTFSPGTPMTRGMFVTVLYRLEGKPSPAAVSSFSDVRNPSEYYYDAVSWASENGVVAGYEEGTFLPDKSITREQMALIMFRYADFKSYDMSSPGSAYDAFPDKSAVSDYAADAMRWAVSKGVINGSDGKLLPSSTATRAQVAQIIFNFCEKITP